MDSQIAKTIQFSIFTSASAGEVFERIATDAGRRSFWVESSTETAGMVQLRFPNDQSLDCEILARKAHQHFSLTYFGGSHVEFRIMEVADGCVVRLTETRLTDESWTENRAGWVSVLLNLKSVLENGADLRNHNSAYTWNDGFVDN